MVLALFTPKAEKELVMFVGPPAAGKSTFFRKNLEPLGYERVNQDQLKTKEKCVKVARELLSQGKNVVIGMLISCYFICGQFVWLHHI